MKALLLAAGLGTRLKPVTDILPKCLVPIGGKPLLEYWFEQLFKADIERALINVHHHSDQIINYIEKSPFRSRIDVVYEKILLNTGGTLLKNRDYFEEKAMMLIHADNFCICDFKAFIACHENRAKGLDITMMTFHTDSPEWSGIVIQNKNAVVIEFYEKVKNPPSKNANSAVYIIEPAVLEKMSHIKSQFINFSVDVIPMFLGRIGTYHNDVYHRDIGTPESYSLAQVDYWRISNLYQHESYEYDITFFVPVYNEQEHLLGTIDTISEAIQSTRYKIEVIICDDASIDGSELVANDARTKYPFLNIRVIKNKCNRGLGFNYFRCSFLSRAKYYMLVNGDNVEPEDTILKIIRNSGQADMIIPHFGSKDQRTKVRRSISAIFSFLINKINGSNLVYYNGPVLHLTNNVRLWRSETVGYGYQAELICRLLQEECSYLEVEVCNRDRQWGTSKAFSVSNILSVTNSLFHILWRRLEYGVFGLLHPGISNVEKHH